MSSLKRDLSVSFQFEKPKHHRINICVAAVWSRRTVTRQMSAYENLSILTNTAFFNDSKHWEQGHSMEI